MKRGVEQTVHRWIAGEGMLDGSRGVLVGLSGGVDSMVLLSLLRPICRERGIPLRALHVHHGIRGAEADRDLRFCEAFCRSREIPFDVQMADAPGEAAASGESLETAARRLRYAALEQMGLARNCDRIATAHHADDNLETMILRLLRGSGTRGLSGIPPVRRMGALTVIRPLLGCTREEILDYARATGIPWVTDSTNADPAYLRSALRLTVMPALRRMAPSGAMAALRSAALLREDADCLEELAFRAEESGEDALPDALLIRRLQNRWEQEAGAMLGGRPPMLEAVHLTALSRLRRKGKLWERVSLPGGLCAERTREGIRFLTDRKKEDGTENEEVPLYPGSQALPWGGFFYLGSERDAAVNETCAKAENHALCKNLYKLSIHITVNSAMLKGVITVRKRRPGDTIRSGGKLRSVKKLLQSAKLTPEQRQRLDFVCDAEGIVWIPGVALRDGLAAADGDTLTLHWIAPEEGFGVKPDREEEHQDYGTFHTPAH